MATIKQHLQFKLDTLTHDLQVCRDAKKFGRINAERSKILRDARRLKIKLKAV